MSHGKLSIHLISYSSNGELLLFLQEELEDLKTIENPLAVFCLATYGEGDPTDNCMDFYEWIQGEVDLTGLNYAVSSWLDSSAGVCLTAILTA